MLWLIPIIGILAVFGMPAYLFKRFFDLKEKQLRLADDNERRFVGQLEGLRDDNEKLRQRIEVLESIVVEGDYELNRRLAAISNDRQGTDSEKRRALPQTKPDGEKK